MCDKIFVANIEIYVKRSIFMSYESFASCYDVLTENVEYEKIANKIDEIFPESYKKDGQILDLGCGTGTLSFLLEEKGFDVIGIDKSEDMLAVSFEKKAELNSGALFLCQDLTELDLFGTVEGAVCVLDTLNHLESLEQIGKFFSLVSLFLEMSGTFVLDMNTPFKHREILADNTFVYDMDDVFCTWQNTYDEKNRRTDIDLDFFFKENDIYYRESESFSEYEYSVDEIVTLLEKNGFTVKNTFDGYTQNAPSDKTERVVIVAQKTRLVAKGELK